MFYLRLVYGARRFRREETIQRGGGGRGLEKKANPGRTSQQGLPVDTDTNCLLKSCEYSVTVCVCLCLQIQSGLGKLILKEEMEKEQIRERHARSLSAQRYDPKQTNCDAGAAQLPQLLCSPDVVQ